MSHGYRRYGEYPVRPMVRIYWEIQCILSGEARPSMVKFHKGKPSGPVLYLFEPKHVHGWNAPAHDLSEMLVFHVSAQNPAWRNFPETKFAAIPLTEIDVVRIKMLFEWLHPHWVGGGPMSAHVLESGGVLLADLVQQKLMNISQSPYGGEQKINALQKVENARHYYRANITRNLQVEDVAQAVGVSSSQLRRIFLRAGQPPPATVFKSLQMDYARRLLTISGRKVNEVADDLGFESLSAFSRSFKKHFGKSPLQLR